tara:strand:+ start:685 stop:1248 length:564 start_codon:yes stop_codon:yes gene_type:complete
MELLHAMMTRRTASGFDQSALKRSVVERVIEAATWAPNHRKTEPWRFHVLAGGARVELGARVASWMRETGEKTESQIESISQKLLRAPVIVVVSQVGSSQNVIQDLEDYAACCCATQNLLLAAHDEGLAAKWSTGLLVTLPPVIEYFGLTVDDRIVGFVYLGYPVDSAVEQQAQRAPAVVQWKGFED